MAIDVRTKTQEVVDLLERPDFLEQIRESLPEGVTLDRFKRVTITAIRSNADLVGADQSSLFGSIVKCAQDGLLPDGREAALVIYSGKVQYLPMIGGYRKIAADHGWSLITQTVRDGDEFDFEEGLEPRLVHRRATPDKRGDLVNAYAIAQHADGRKLFAVLDAAEIAKCRDVSRAKDKAGAPWTTWTERMWEKTAGKRLFKQLPLGELDQDRLERMLAAERALEAAAADPVEALYGRENGVASQPEGARAADVPEGDTARGDGPDGAPSVSSPVAAAPEPDAEEAEWEPVDDEPAALTAAEVEKAGKTKVSRGEYRGKTFAQVAETGEDGETWLLVQLKRTPADSPGRAPIETFVRGALPELWQRYQRWQETQ